MRLSTDNWSKPSNPRLKFWADLFIYTLPLYLSAVLALPDEAVGATAKVWVNFGMTVVIITFKMISKLTSDEQS